MGYFVDKRRQQFVNSNSVTPLLRYMAGHHVRNVTPGHLSLQCPAAKLFERMVWFAGFHLSRDAAYTTSPDV